jgi:hypothetical protein
LLFDRKKRNRYYSIDILNEKEILINYIMRTFEIDGKTFDVFGNVYSNKIDVCIYDERHTLMYTMYFHHRHAKYLLKKQKRTRNWWKRVFYNQKRQCFSTNSKRFDKSFSPSRNKMDAIFINSFSDLFQLAESLHPGFNTSALGIRDLTNPRPYLTGMGGTIRCHLGLSPFCIIRNPLKN